MGADVEYGISVPGKPGVNPVVRLTQFKLVLFAIRQNLIQMAVGDMHGISQLRDSGHSAIQLPSDSTRK